MVTRVLIVAALMLAATVAFAQGRGGMRGGMGMMQGDNGLMLIGRADVQKDLGITPEQKTKIDAMQEAMREEMRNAFAGGPPSNPEAMMQQMQKRQEELRKQLATILTPEQNKRLGEIRIQLAGNRAIMDPEVQKELGLTDAQKTKIKELQELQQEANRSVMDQMRNGDMEREEGMAALRRNNDVMSTELGKVLTPEQAAKMKTMAGKPFTADPNQGGQRGNRPGGGRGGAGGARGGGTPPPPIAA